MREDGGTLLAAGYMTWDEWFRAFEDNKLALLIQEETASGERSNFNKLVSRQSVTSR